MSFKRWLFFMSMLFATGLVAVYTVLFAVAYGFDAGMQAVGLVACSLSLGMVAGECAS